MKSTQSLLLLAGITFASLASAQGSGVITGVVSTPDQPAVADQRVTLTSPALAEPKVAVTDSSGTYRFSQLPPGTYSLKLERERFRPAVKRGILVRLDATLQLDIGLRKAIGATEETLPVGAPPTVDVGAASQGVTLGKDFLDRVPLVTPNALGARTIEQAAMAAPQVVADRYGFGFSGGLSPENAYLVDGAQVNDPRFGTLRGTVGAGGSQVPLEFVDQVNVMTGALAPELGRSSGGVLEVVTKSGGNEWHGSLFGSWQPGAFTATSKLASPDTSSFAFSSKRHNTGDFGGEVGGALVKDKLWFYGGLVQSVDRQRVTRTVRQFALTEDGKDFLFDENGAIHFEPLVSSSAFDDRRSLTWLAKFTLFLTPAQTLSATFTGGPQRRLTPDFAPKGHVATVDSTDTTTSVLRYSGAFFDRALLVDATASWTHFEQSRLPNDGSRIGDTKGFAGTPQLEFTRTAPYSISTFETLPGDLALRCEPADFTPTRTVTSRGTVRFVMACPATGVGAPYRLGGPGLMTESQSDRLAAKASATYHFQLLGHHTLKAGVDLDWTRARVLSAYSGSMQLSETADGKSFVGTDFARLVGPDQRIGQLSTTSTPSQLSMGAFVGDSWNLVDAVRVNAGLRYDTQQLFGSNGDLGVSFNNVLSPRIGLVYDFTKQGRSKVFANYGLYQQALPLNVAGRGLSGETRTLTVRRSDSCSALDDPKSCVTAPSSPVNTNPLAPSSNAVQLPSTPLAIDPQLKPMLKGEVTAGLEYEIWSQLRVGFVGTHSWLINAVETLSNDGGSTWFLGNPGGGLLGKDFAPIDRKYFAATLYANKAFTNGWLVQGSYTFSSLSGTYAGLFRPETGTLDPNLTGELGLPSTSANRTGFLPTDHTHQLKAYVAKDFELSNEWLASVGASYEGLSGAPVSYLAADPVLGAASTFVFPRGSAGRLGFSHTVNVRGQVGYRLSRDQTLQFTVDVFNLFNAQETTEVLQQLSSAAIQPGSVPEGKTAAEAACLAGNDPRCVSVLKKTNGSTVTAADLDPTFKQTTFMQAPLSVRLGVKLSF